ncbi:hypothetical protein DL96DRAFT_1809847 [Flagelloscypha sp. PMI_526]|nr:hypothetical protein DL96DRAFT_1809847 [Flagelloscypha sp. PMI_526]
MRLTPQQTEIVEEAAARFFRYERTAEKHADFFRQNMNEYLDTYVALEKNAPLPRGYLPKPEEVEDHTAQSEAVLEKECVTVEDHLNAFNAAMYLCQIVMRQMANLGLYNECCKRKTALRQANPIVVDRRQLGMSIPMEHPAFDSLFAGTSANSMPSVDPIQRSPSPPGTDVPPFMTANSELTTEETEDLTRAPVTKEQIKRYRAHPLELNGLIFSGDNENGEIETVRVYAVLVVGTETYFYLQVADEGREAYVHTDKDFFYYLGTAKRLGV